MNYKQLNETITGYVHPDFQPVLDAMTENFSERGELGASLSFSVDGETVVDVWGGHKSRHKEAEAWTEDTVSIVFSCTKGATALCAHHLVDRGRLDLDALVGEYWPEFATHGKEYVTVRMMLNHSAGVPALREPVEKGGYYNWDYMCERLAAEAPFWNPGTRNGYHMMTFGWTVGELVRRASGQSLGDYFQEHIAGPLDLDFSIGLPDEEHGRVSRMQQWKPEKGDVMAPFTTALLKDSSSLQYLALLNNGGHKSDSAEAWRSQLGGGGGIANGRALARMYAPLAGDGRVGDTRLLASDTIEAARAVSVATMEDATLLMPSRFGLGFMRSMDNRSRASGKFETMVLGREAFGHAGAGGSVGFADPEAGLAFGYTMNQMGGGILLNERGQALVDATYRCLGYRTSAPGFWVR